MKNSIDKAKSLTQDQKVKYLAKYLNKYIDTCISIYTNNKELLNEVLSNETLLGLIVYSIDAEQEKCLEIERHLSLPFETSFTTCNYTCEVNHILYELLIKDRS